MPQMMPLNWFMLFIYFSILFMVFNSFNYYMFLPQKKNMFMKISTNIMYWKW